MNLAYTFLIMAALGLIGLAIAVYHFNKQKKIELR
jgi:mannose/fructose/N-acetylgalactosamine-specific phosphotransferase system component IIC